MRARVRIETNVGPFGSRYIIFNFYFIAHLRSPIKKKKKTNNQNTDNIGLQFYNSFIPLK